MNKTNEQRIMMTDQEKLDFLTQAIRELYKNKTFKQLSPDDRLKDLGLDSLDIVELQMYYEEKTGVITANEGKISTISDLMKIMTG